MGNRTTPIRDRGDGNRNRASRIKQMKQGPGTFVYRGGHHITTQKPTLLREKLRVPKEVDGQVVLDTLDRIVYEHVYGDPILDHKKKAQMGGPPIYTRVELETFTLWGTDFPRDVPIYVDDPKLALKLRCHGSCEEVESEDLTDEERAGVRKEQSDGRKGRRKTKAVEETEDQAADE